MEETAYHFYKFNRRECSRNVGTTTLSREEVRRFSVDQVSLFFGKTVFLDESTHKIERIGSWFGKEFKQNRRV